MSSRTTVARGSTPSILIARTEGGLTEKDGLALGSQVTERLDADHRISQLLIDLRGLTACELLGRAALGQLQTVLKSRKIRTAYLTATPRFRGMTLIVIQSVIDENAGTFVTEEQANEWLAGEESRASLHTRRIGAAR